MDKLDAQPEFTKAPWDYLDLLVSDDRIARGRAAAGAIRAGLRRGRARLWRRPHHRRGDLGRRIGLRHDDRRPAGACARPQRSPASAAAANISAASSWRRWKYCSAATSRPTAWSAPGPAPSARRNSCRPRFCATRSISTATGGATSSNSIPDMIASTANNLQIDGWVPGQTWGYEVALPQSFNYLLADSPRQMTVRQWESLGLRRANGQPFPHAAERARLLLPAGARGPAFLMLPKFPRHHEIQSGRGLCAGDRASGRPAARRRPAHPSLAARRARADAAGAL